MPKISDLLVLDTLKVHDLVIHPKGVKATYTVIHDDGTSFSNELRFSYDAPLFSEQQATDLNLASMMVAQVALNYGLFFRKIVFDGLFDKSDMRFLTDMMENTSREILVNKFFAKNEFLKTPFNEIIPEKHAKYTQAELVFENTNFRAIELKKEDTYSDYSQFAILSSGGKDSLLTYGLVKELGEAHPIFINESGRHWFTAINAYRYFKDAEPYTRKPWCNSDRIFNWMLRQLPFIKENFQNIRADIYPIRMWTVAVFIFGALPIVRKQKIGNLLIGNEYDTTVKGNFNGITHYHGLYDQSKYFDNALTRYYTRKGWNIHQYSMLRSLSELLIMKILVKRYPELQKFQISCHAAHEQNGKMVPCGNCEKCRRIIGLLTALDEDPKRCGYNEDQIEKGLRSLASKGVKQIGSDAAHLYYLLLKKDKIINNEHTRKLARPHPEIVKIRLDNERSKLEDLPVTIRKQILDIFDIYSDGIVQLTDKKWTSISKDDLDFTIKYVINKFKNDEA